MAARTFGKRASVAPAPVRREAKAAVVAPDIVRAVRVLEQKPVAVEKPPAAVVPSPELSVDEELRRWKEERRQTLFFRLPWKQFSLFASISFGAASFVLPDDVNGAVDYLLWGLSLISFAVWVSGFFRKKAAP